MNQTSLLETLRDVLFLHGLADKHLEKLAEAAELVDLQEGKVIFRGGDRSSHVFLIVAGKVSLEICAPGIGCKRVFTVGDGELLGCSPVLGEGPLTATARTMTATKAIALDGPQIRVLCEHDPDFGFEFMRRTAKAMAKRLTATRQQLLQELGTQNASVVSSQ